MLCLQKINRYYTYIKFLSEGHLSIYLSDTSSIQICPSPAYFSLWPQIQGWKYVQLVGSDLDLRKVSWKKRVDIIPSRFSTDTETSSDEAPRPSYAQTPLPGEEHSIRPTDRQLASMPAIVHRQSRALQVNQRFSLPSWFDPLRTVIVCFWASVPVPLPLAGTYSICPPASCPERSIGINCSISSWWSGAGFPRCLSLSVISPPSYRGGDQEAAFWVCVNA